jgi:hypothetical protein
MAVIASEAWQSVGLMKRSLKASSHELTDCFVPRNDSYLKFYLTTSLLSKHFDNKSIVKYFICNYIKEIF